MTLAEAKKMLRDSTFVARDRRGLSGMRGPYVVSDT